MDQLITLSGYLWLRCFEYLNQVEISKCQRVCVRWNSTLQQETQSKAKIFNTFLIPSNTDPIEYFQWFLKNSCKMNSFCYYDLRGDLSFQNLKLLLKKVSPQKLKLAFITNEENQIREILEENLQITHIYIQANLENQKFFDSLSKLNLKSLKLVSDFIDESNEIKNIPQVEKLNLQVRTLPWESILNLVDNSKYCLRKLIIDGDELSDEEILKITSILNPHTMEYFGVRYGEQFNEDIISSLKGLEKLKKIEIRKARYLPSESFQDLLQNQSLKKLNLAFCETVQDSAVLSVFQNSRNLRILDVSWCQITNQAIQQQMVINIQKRLMFNNCLFIEKVSLVGCKYLDDQCFPQISEIIKHKIEWVKLTKSIPHQKAKTYLDIEHPYCKYEISLYKRLKFLNCTKCDYITDELLQLLKVYRSGIKILNYYADEIESLF